MRKGRELKDKLMKRSCGLGLTRKHGGSMTRARGCWSTGVDGNVTQLLPAPRLKSRGGGRAGGAQRRLCIGRDSDRDGVSGTGPCWERFAGATLCCFFGRDTGRERFTGTGPWQAALSAAALFWVFCTRTGGRSRGRWCGSRRVVGLLFGPKARLYGAGSGRH